MPVFALGRAQELMLVLEEYWQNHSEELGNGQVPIYYASDLARKCMSVYQTYVNMMNDNIRKKFRNSQTNPFIFKNIAYLKNLDDFEDFGPSVMLASPGMLQSGISRDLLERWCPEEKNLVLITGYSVEGTMAKYIILEPDTIPSVNNPEISIPRRCQVEEISFAAHVDFQENLEFIQQIHASNIILVHGESNPMGRLKSALLSNFSSLKGTENEVHVYNPRNSVEVSIEFKGIKIAKAIGNIVDEICKEEDEIRDIKHEEEARVTKVEEDSIENDIKKETNNNDIKIKDEIEDTMTKKENDFGSDIIVSGLLVSDDKNFDLNLVSLSDLREHHTELSTTILKERQTIKVNCKKELVYWHICQMFGDVTIIQDDENITGENIVKKEKQETKSREDKKLILQIMGDVHVTLVESVAIVEWTQGLVTDTIADSVVAILMAVDSAPASVRMSSRHCNHDHSGVAEHNSEEEILNQQQEITWKIKKVVELFKEQFGDAFTLDLNETSGTGTEKTNTDIIGTITLGKHLAKVNFTSMKVEKCNSNPLKGRVESILSIGGDLVSTLC